MRDIHINLSCKFKGIEDGEAKCGCTCEGEVLNSITFGNYGTGITAAMLESLLNCMRDNFGMAFEIAMLDYMRKDLELDAEVKQEYRDTFGDMFGDLFDDE